MTVSFYSRPIIPLLMALICGIALGVKLPGYQLGMLLLMPVGLSAMVYRIVNRQASRWCPLMLYVLLGYLSVQPWMAPRENPDHIRSHLKAQFWNISGTVIERPKVWGNRQRLILDVWQLKDAQHTIHAKGRVQVTVYGRYPVIALGDNLRLRSRLKPFRNFNNPGAFNYERYMHFKGIWASAYAPADKIVVEKETAPNRIPKFVLLIEAIRGKVGNFIVQRGTNAANSVLQALLIGDRGRIPESVNEAFYRTGIGHLLAISGLHIGIVAALAFFIFSRLCLRLKSLLWSARSKKVAALAAIVPVVAYGLLAGMSPSTQRAVIMAILFLLAFVFERRHDIWNTLAIAALVILVVQPTALFSISFQLSFMAVVSILYGLSQTSGQDRLATPWGRLGQKLTIWLLVSVFAILGTLPLGMYYFNRISVIGLIANVLLVPIIGFMVVPLGLIAISFLPLSSQLAIWIMECAAQVLAAALELIHYLSDFAMAALPTFTPTVLEIGLYYAILAGVLNFLGKRMIIPAAVALPQTSSTQAEMTDKPDRDTPIQISAKRPNIFKLPAWFKLYGRPWHYRKALFIVLILVMLFDAGYWLHQRYWHQDLRVTAIDVGQGTSSLLELPGGKTVLIDGGGFTDNSIFDIGQRVIAPVLWRKRIMKLDILALSHPNSDHLNGLLYIADNFPVKEVWTNGQSRKTLGYRQLINIIRRKEIKWIEKNNACPSITINGVTMDILYPQPGLVQKMAANPWRNANNNSLVLKATYQGISFLFPGDIMAAAEKELVATRKIMLNSTVLMAPHHGSRTSSSNILLDAVRPSAVVISAGWRNRFHFPHQKVLHRYAKRQIQIFRTDLHGAVELYVRKYRLRIRSTLPPAANRGRFVQI